MSKILLICGGGASSGFMAAAARKAAKKMKLEMEFKARSDSELNDYLSENDLLLIAPHLNFMAESIEPEAKKAHIKVAVIPQAIYGSLDGSGLVKFAQEQLGE